jgi:hypothetical protein
MDKVDMEAEMRAVRVYATSILRLCNNTILPFEVVTVADETLTALGELQARAKGVIDLSTLMSKAERLKDEAARLSAKTNEISKHGRGGQEPRGVSEVNNCLMRLSRILNPILYTAVGRYEQDRYGASYLTKPIPVLQSVSELASLDPDSTEYKALRTKLTREMNKVSDALEEASSLMRETVEKTRR